MGSFVYVQPWTLVDACFPPRAHDSDKKEIYWIYSFAVSSYLRLYHDNRLRLESFFFCSKHVMNLIHSFRLFADIINSQRIITLSAQGTLVSSPFLEHGAPPPSICVCCSSRQVCSSREHLQVLTLLPLHVFTLTSPSHYELFQDLI